MKINNFIKELELIKREHGDLEVTTILQDKEYGECYNVGIKIDINSDTGMITIH